ncbi:LUD domain-containing protein [Catellatospora vulcania]|uniref:LUD domain-containing protein n=1 Tax=Catellatospora vulcania TaxID=1460450 RepID=UPI0012D49AF2|nr:LUD domain-containing protein [Catellatospora vulcania]
MTQQAPALDESFAAPVSAAVLDRTVAALRANNFTVHVVDTVDEARKLVVDDILPRDAAIFTASSETLRLSGILGDVDESGDFRSVRADAGDLGDDMWARIRLGAVPDVVVGSVHAVTEQGHLVVGSATGSQFAPYAAGAEKAVWVVGAQKIVPDLETGLRRLRTYSLPKEWRRLNDLAGQTSFLSRVLIIEQEWLPDRGVVVLVREPIGF